MQVEELKIIEFLENCGYSEFERHKLAGDASFRRYERLRNGDRGAMLMVAPPETEDTRPFIKIDEILRANGLNAPEIIAKDVQAGLLLLEDFGDDLYSKVIPQGLSEIELYENAVDVLAKLPSQADIPEYSTQKLLEEASLFTDWFAKDSDKDSYISLWKELLGQLDNSKQVLVLRDYHADNLLWLPQREGVHKVGLLDFQDAVLGHPAYDLVSLLQDARRDVSRDTVEQLLAGKSEEFIRDYQILGAQRNCKIVGIFNRLKLRDGKDNYLKFLPRVWGHLRENLAHPALLPLKEWMDENVDQT